MCRWDFDAGKKESGGWAEFVKIEMQWRVIVGIFFDGV